MTQILWDEIPVQTKEYLKVVDITDRVQAIFKKQKIKWGNLTVYNPHVTSAVLPSTCSG